MSDPESFQPEHIEEVVQPSHELAPQDQPVNIARRSVLRAGFGATLSAFLASCGFGESNKAPQQPSATRTPTPRAAATEAAPAQPPAAPTTQPETTPEAVATVKPTEAPAQATPEAAKEGKLIIDRSREQAVSFRQLGIEHIPDGHLPYVTFPDGKRAFFPSGGVSAFSVPGNGEGSLTAPQGQQAREVRKVFGPDGNVRERNGYSAITSVFRLDPNNPYHLYALTHNEQHARDSRGQQIGGFQASVSWLFSRDGGQNWEDRVSRFEGKKPYRLNEGRPVLVSHVVCFGK